MGFIPEELISEILSFLDVKTILRLKCVSKSWNALISNPTFVEKHLNKSSQNPQTLMYGREWENNSLSSIRFPVSSLLENPSITIQNDTLHQLEFCVQFAGSCNGLICLVSHHLYATQRQYQCRLWNPSTRTTYQDLVVLSYDPRDCVNPRSHWFMFRFGYDDSTRTYKIVAYHVECDEENRVASGKSEVKVLSVGDGENCWRNIQSFPVIPLDWRYNPYTRANHLNGTIINWLAINNYFYSYYEYESITHVEQFVIVSLDLSTETYKQLLLPQGFDEVPFVQPNLNVLMGCLCLFHDSKKMEFVLWQMKEYGVQESWTRLFKISKQNLKMHYPGYAFELVCLYINGDTVIFANIWSNRAVVYNLRDQRGETIEITNTIHVFSRAMDYVESLVSVP